MPESDSYQKFSFAVKKSDLKYFNKYLETFVNYSCAKRQIPYQLVGKFFNLIIDLEKQQNDKLYNDALDLMQKAADYFKTCANGTYNFELALPINKNIFNSGYIELDGDINEKPVEKSPGYYNLNELFLKCAKKYYLLINEDRITGRVEVMRLFYTQIAEYKILTYNRKDKKRCNHYRMSVMAAYLTSLVGYKVCSKKEFKNEDLYQSSKNILKDFNKIKAAK